MNINFLRVLGPGILFAGAAIGTSHLVQSTRAGALYGLAFFSLIIFANFIKYPIFRFGPLYTAQTGSSILHGYRSLGSWALVLLIVTELPVNIIIIAVTALVTAGITLHVFNLDIQAGYLACLFILIALGLISSGGYKLIDYLVKWFVAVLSICTLIATALTVPLIDWSIESLSLPDFDAKTLAFALALLGFMPAGTSLAIMHSIWSVEKSKQLKQTISPKAAMLDLNVGYLGSVAMALCFLIMGAGTFGQHGTELARSPSEFSGQVIQLYSTTLGNWVGQIVGVSVFAVMMSTLLTTIDGFARLQKEAISELISEHSPNNNKLSQDWAHPLAMAILSLGAMVVLLNFISSFKAFIDFVTITAFITGPVIAILNHCVMHGSTVPIESRPSKVMTAWSLAGIVFLVSLSGVYLLS